MATFTITATAGTGGTVTPSGAVVVTQGDAQAFTIVPASGYRVLCVSVDGVSQGSLLTYTFTNVQADHTLDVTFLLVDYINHIADAIVTALRTINGPAGGYTVDFTNAQIERAPTLLDWTTVKRPYLGVRFDEITGQEPLTYGQYRVSGNFVIGFLIDMGSQPIDRAAPERLGAIYAQDIMRAIALDVNLGHVLDNGVAYPAGVTVSQDPQLGMFMAYGSVTVAATWSWQA